MSRQQLVETALDAALDRTRSRALANIEKWGLQESTTLILCMIEELGEVAQEEIGVKLTVASDPGAAVAGVDRMGVEALDLAALCCQLVVLCEVCVGPGLGPEASREGRPA